MLKSHEKATRTDFETFSIDCHALLVGIERSMRMLDQWSVFPEQRDFAKKQLPGWLNACRGDGLISRATTPKPLDAVTKVRVPLPK